VVGLVAEGVTDLDFLKLCIEKTLGTYGFGRRVEFRDLQPEPDATSGQYGDGGWSRVHQWCVNNPPAARLSQYLQPLFEDERACDFLVVHLDGDVLADYADKVSSTPLPIEPWTGDTRAEFVRAALNEWLWPGDSDAAKDKHLLAVMVRALETWLLAGYDVSLEHPEEVGPIPLLRQASPHLLQPVRPDARLRKRRKTWKKMAEEVIGNLPHIRSVCPCCDQFLAQVENRMGSVA